MAVLLSQFLFLVLVTHIQADYCFERFGTNKVNCIDTNGLCLWVEKEGEGECMMPRHHGGNHTDACFERFGTNKENCTATEGLCMWVEEDGEGKCAHTDGADTRDNQGGVGRHGKGGHKADEKGDGGNRKEESTMSHGKGVQKSSKDGGHRGQDGADRGRKEHGRKSLQKITAVLSLSINSSLSSPYLLDILKQNSSLLENALAHSRAYQKVTILGLYAARRLREAINSQVNVRFEAEASRSRQSSGEANAQLKEALQDSFAEAGFDFQVQSAIFVISSTEPMSAHSGNQHRSARFLTIGAIAAGLIFCLCGSLLCFCLRRIRPSALKPREPNTDLGAAPVYGVPCKDDEKCDTDIDLASISTGTPSTTQDLSFAVPVIARVASV